MAGIITLHKINYYQHFNKHSRQSTLCTASNISTGKTCMSFITQNDSCSALLEKWAQNDMAAICLMLQASNSNSTNECRLVYA